MGCASSKQKVCRKCKAPYSPVRRSFSTHHRRKKSGEDTDHRVSLTSSTLGSLNLPDQIQDHDSGRKDTDEEHAPIIHNQNQINPGSDVEGNSTVIENRETVGIKTAKDEFAMSMIEAKTWSEMIDKKIPKIVPKTPIRTPPGEPETINIWELMEGLEGISPPGQFHHFRSFSFHVSSCHESFGSTDDEQPTSRVTDHGDAPPPPPPPPPPTNPSSNIGTADSDSNSNLNDATSIISEFDPEVIASFRKALEDLPPANPFQLKPMDKEKESMNKIVPCGSKERLTVYFTSLRGVRKTYEDCCHVRVILKGLGVKVDERDVSMHAGFKEELKELLGEGFGGLPRIFIGKKYIGGADEIRRLNEEGRLEKTMENCELLDSGNGNRNGNVCESCGDIRFVPCGTCSGSCKIYREGDYEDEDDEEHNETEQDFGFQRCPDCNENGLIRCPICCDD